MDNSFYMTGSCNVWKLDQDLNILIKYNPGGYPGYLGISYNPSNGLLFDSFPTPNLYLNYPSGSFT